MITGKWDELTKLTKTHRCAEHFDTYTLSVVKEKGEWTISCGADHFPEEIKALPSLTSMFKSGAELPEPIKHNIEKGIAKRREPLHARLHIAAPAP